MGGCAALQLLARLPFSAVGPAPCLLDMAAFEWMALRFLGMGHRRAAEGSLCSLGSSKRLLFRLRRVAPSLCERKSTSLHRALKCMGATSLHRALKCMGALHKKTQPPSTMCWLQVTFRTRIYHCNINSSGAICLDILKVGCCALFTLQTSCTECPG
jgi:hypothetical protein